MALATACTYNANSLFAFLFFASIALYIVLWPKRRNDVESRIDAATDRLCEAHVKGLCSRCRSELRAYKRYVS